MLTFIHQMVNSIFKLQWAGKVGNGACGMRQVDLIRIRMGRVRMSIYRWVLSCKQLVKSVCRSNMSNFFYIFKIRKN